MGWCSGTEIFDDVVAALVEEGKRPPVEKVIERLVAALENGDWDCQQDSAYWDHPVVRKVFLQVHPDWFDEEGEDR